MSFLNIIKNKVNNNNILRTSCRNFTVAGFLTLASTNVMALDTTFSLHKGDESKTSGISIAVADYFSKKSNVYWSVGYSTLNDVKVTWNSEELFFKSDTIDATIGYRHKIKSYNEFFKKVTIDYHAGLSYALTDNKFIFKDLDNHEEVFSESGDVNAIVGIAAHYNFNKKSAVTLGLKHQPSFSDFGSVSSVYIGFNYKFGKVVGY